MTIKLVITGGTIDKSYNMHHGELHFIDTHIPAMLSQGRCKARIELDELMLKDSLDMDESDRLQILAVCQQTACNKIIITHGTDTMVRTAQFLESQISDKTIVLTGAMIPCSVDKSDALFNLGSAFGAVQCLAAGVYITMNGRVFAAEEVVKNLQEGIFETVRGE